jgi:hypothetical protein
MIAIVESGAWKLLAGAGLYEAMTLGTLIEGLVGINAGSSRRLRVATVKILKAFESLMIFQMGLLLL